MTYLRGEDVRAVANEIIAAHPDVRLTNLSLQKVIYFLHGQYLLSTQTPLVSGYFEAWEFGPVHPTLYGALRHLGSRPVDQLIQRKSIHSGKWECVPPILDANVQTFVLESSRSLVQLSARQLVDLSHARNSPWDIATRCGQRRTWGLRLDNDLISMHFKHHKRSVTDFVYGDIFEEYPPSGD